MIHFLLPEESRQCPASMTWAGYCLYDNCMQNLKEPLAIFIVSGSLSGSPYCTKLQLLESLLNDRKYLLLGH